MTRKKFNFLVLPLLTLALVIVTLLLGPYGGAALWVLMGLVTAYIFYFEEDRKTLNPVLEGLMMIALGLLAVALTIPQTRYVKHPRDSDPSFGGRIYGPAYEEALRDPGVQELNARARAGYGSGARRGPKP